MEKLNYVDKYDTYILKSSVNFVGLVSNFFSSTKTERGHRVRDQPMIFIYFLTSLEMS